MTAIIFQPATLLEMKFDYIFKFLLHKTLFGKIEQAEQSIVINAFTVKS